MSASPLVLLILSANFIASTWAELLVKKPRSGTGPLIISEEDLEDYYYNPQRLLFVFNRNCTRTLNQSEEYDEILEYIDTIKSTYSICMQQTNNSMNVQHYDTHLYSYVFFDLLCSAYSLSEGQHSNLTMDYNALCIEYITYEPLFNVSSTVQAVPASTPQFACLRANTAYYESYGMDLLDSTHMDYEYSFPHFTNASISEQRKIDIHILDSGIQADHVEFAENQVTHKMGDGPAVHEHKYGDHGTHVAALAAGLNFGSARLFPIYDYRVCEYTDDGKEMPCYGNLIFSALFMAFERIQRTGKPAVINLSLGGPKMASFDDVYQYFFDAIVAVGGIPVVAAGNEGEDACKTSPAYSTSAITVGSYDRSRKQSWFSNWGNCVDIWAPGTSIYSALASSRDDKYGYKDGTSMASPYVTGMVANLLYLNPSLTFHDIKEILRASGDQVSGRECDEYTCNRAEFTCESPIVYDLPYQLSTLDIVLIVLGCVAFVAIVVMCALCIVKKQKEKKQEEQQQGNWQYDQDAYEQRTAGMGRDAETQRMNVPDGKQQTVVPMETDGIR